MRWESTAGDGVAGFNAAFDPNFNSVLFDCSAIATGSSDAAAVAGATTGNGNVVGPSSLSSTFFPGPAEGSVTPFNVTTLGAFFTPVTYIGAFGPSETPTSNWAAGWTFQLFPPAGCPTGTTDSGSTVGGVRVCNVTGVYTSDLRLTAGNAKDRFGNAMTVKLKGKVEPYFKS